MESKTCTNCKQELPAEQFEVFKKGGVRSICNKCRNHRRVKDPRGYLARLCSKLKHSRKGTHEWALTPDDLMHLWEKQNGKCAVSGMNLTWHVDGRGHKEFNASIDRINPDAGYTPDNVQLVCYRVNIMRHTLSVDMFWWWVKNIHDHSIE